jgi:hypothetical protein
MLLKHLSTPLLAISPAAVTAYEAQRPIANTPHIAPLKCPSDTSKIIPESFAVQLAPGHSLQAHIKAVGRKIVPWYVMRSDRDEDRVMYFGDGIGEELLERIREDKGVEGVWCDAKVVGV